MMRAGLILVGIGTLVAMELRTPPRAATAVNQPLVESTVGTGDSRDTLAKPDRLEIPYFQNEPIAQQISLVERMPPADSTPIISKVPSKIVSANRHDARTSKVAVISSKPRPESPESKPRPKTMDKTTDSKTVTNTDRAKAPVDVKPCRPNVFDSFLKALNLSSGCEA